TLSIRADEDVWPSYVPPTSADTGSLPASDIDITPAAPVATTGVAPVDTPVLPSQPSGVEQPYSAPNQEYIPIHEAPVQPVTEDTQAQPLAAEPIVEVSPSAPIEEQVAQSTQYADGPLDLSALFDQMQIDTSARPIPRPIVTAPEPPVEVQPEPAGPSIAPAQAEPAPPPSRPQTVMPITITPTSSTQPNLGNSYQGSAVSPYDAAAWQAFSGMGGAGGKATAPQEETSSQEQATWQQFAQSGAPDPYATGVGPADQANAEAWQPAPGMPRPQRGTPEYDAMVRAALAQRGIPYNPSTPAPQAQPQQPQAQPSWQPQPGQPRPKPGTPEYEEMARAALAQRGIGTGPLPSSPASSSQPYQSSPQQPQAQPAWQPQPGQPRPKPGTPEYEEMVRQALAQRGISTGPLPSQSPSQNQGPPASPYDSSQPRPKPGTPEYEEMVRQALNERRQREGR
ncbi:MAG TPA: hypothetical protein VJ183_14880, partial [Chloroflexia bacterium]|nr:hypothetical protein [Chloroflexia bacterium]